RGKVRRQRGMTYKNSVMGLNLGGGKAVIIGDPRKDKSEELFRALGRFVESLGGRYYTAEDVGTSAEDMTLVHQETRFVAGLPQTSGDPSPATAYGVYQGMRACAEEAFGSPSLKGKRVALQGGGHVGYHLARLLSEDGAELVVSDIYQDRVQRLVTEFGARAVPPEEIYGVEADVFAPCALGAILNDETIPRLKVRVVAGSANNQLQEERHGEELQRRGIVYAPDFVINGGGVTNVADELQVGGYNRERAYARIAKIFDKVAQILEMARRESVSTSAAANRMAEDRISRLAGRKNYYLPGEK
ncbi:MAG: leucine dehydrogenase, partial [Firmicutes bacterium]|nr:leucine dehydrogenase [Bacillota bacterium]